MCHRWSGMLFPIKRENLYWHTLPISVSESRPTRVDLVYTLTIVYAVIWFNPILCTLSKRYVHWTDSFWVPCYQTRSQRNRSATMMNPHRLSGWPQNVLPHGGVYHFVPMVDNMLSLYVFYWYNIRVHTYHSHVLFTCTYCFILLGVL